MVLLHLEINLVLNVTLFQTDSQQKNYTNQLLENYDKIPKFDVADHVKTSKNKNNFAKGYTPNQTEVFMKKNCKRQIKQGLEWKK